MTLLLIAIEPQIIYRRVVSSVDGAQESCECQNFWTHEGSGLPSLLGGIGQDLVSYRFAEAGKVKGHGFVDLVGLNIMGGVVAVVVGIRVADTLGSIRGFSTTLSLYYLLFVWWVVSLLCLLCGITSGVLCLLGVMVYWAFQGRWGWGEEGQLPGPLVLGRSSSFWLKMGKGNIWKFRVCMKSVMWSSLF